jgi:hypothetical protein
MTAVPAALLAAAVAVVAWDVGLAGRIAQRRGAPAPFRVLSGLAGFLVAPAVLLGGAASWPPTAAALSGAAWAWPLVAWLFAAQASIALVGRLVTPWVALPILAWDVAVAVEASVRWGLDAGFAAPAAATAVAGAWDLAARAVAGPVADRAWWVAVPALAPAYPAAWPLSRLARGAIAIGAAAGVAALAASLPTAWRYRRAADALGDPPPLTRDVGEVVLGVRVFPVVAGPPPTTAAADLRAAAAAGARALHVRVRCDASGTRALEGLARALEGARRDGAALAVSCVLPRGAAVAYARDPRSYLAARARDADRVVRVLKPDLLIPVEAPGGGAAALPRAAWPDVVTVPGNVARTVEPRTRVAVAVAAHTAADSALYGWAAGPLAPVQAVVIELPVAHAPLAPWRAALARAAGWQRARPAPREHWLAGLAAPVRPLGEAAQGRVLAHAVRDAARAGYAGVLLGDVADYDAATGVRTPTGRPRAAVAALRRLLAALPPPAA